MELENGNYASPRWSYEILDCAMPMSFDTYSNCAHQCLYCFSFFQRAIGKSADDYLHHKVRSVNVDNVKRMFLNPDKHGGQFKNYIKARMTLQWGGLSDGFDWYERKFGKSLELLRFFREIDYPVSISTKGVWFVDEPEYREVLKDAKNVHFKYSIITSIEEHVKKLEPGTPSASERFEALRKLNELNIGATTLRYRPYILGTSDLCVDDMMKRGADAGCYSVTTEFLTWESRASVTSRERLKVMSEVLGYDVWDFYMKNSSRASGLLRLNYDLKRPHILKLKESAEKHGLKFFVSDAHHKEESYHAGCCGLPESGPLSNVNHGQYAHAILIAKEKGFVRWSDISQQAKELLNEIPVFAAEGFPSDSMFRLNRRYQSMYDYMHDVWNNPQSWQSPNRYFGGALVAAQPDENGDVIYLYNKPFIELNERVESVNELAKTLRMTGKDNAQRFDEMSADGTDFGHVAYPVYVFSRKRAIEATTMKLLQRSRLNHFLVVSNEDYDEYVERYSHSDILIVSEKDSISKARQFVLDRVREEGYPYVWMLDDDIQNILDKDGKSVSFRNIFSTLEKWVEDYSNVAMLGANASSGKFMVNAPVGGLMLVNTQTGIDFTPGVELYEDTMFALSHLATGKWVTVAHRFTVEYANIQSGGAYHIKLDELRNGMNAEMVEEAHPEYVFSMKDNIVRWQDFPNAIKSRNVEALMKGE